MPNTEFNTGALTQQEALYRLMQAQQLRRGQVIRYPDYADAIFTRDIYGETRGEKRARFRKGGKKTGAEKLDVWMDWKGDTTEIAKMNKKELRDAISQLEKGWTCYGQKNKIISLKRVLEGK